MPLVLQGSLGRTVAWRFDMITLDQGNGEKVDIHVHLPDTGIVKVSSDVVMGGVHGESASLCEN